MCALVLYSYVERLKQFFLQQVFVVTWEIQVLKVKRDPLLSGPQALLVHLEEMAGKEYPEIVLMATQDPQERGVLQECQG